MAFRLLYRFFSHGLLVAASLAVAASVVSCDREEEIDRVRQTIASELKSLNVYERGNLPRNINPENIAGYYDIIDGAIRWIENDNATRFGRENLPEIHAGDRITFYFDARIYKSNFNSSETFYTNIESVMEKLAGDNPLVLGGDEMFWSTAPMEITVGDDPQILKHIQTALIGCRADDGISSNDDIETNPIKSDVVRIYLPYDIGFGRPAVGIIPPRSTLVYQISKIQLLGRN
jgi:hypothetical protein